MVQWLNADTGVSNISNVASMVVWLNKGNTAWVGGPSGWVQVGVTQPEAGGPYLRTHADGSWSDNLRSLPTF